MPAGSVPAYLIAKSVVQFRLFLPVSSMFRPPPRVSTFVPDPARKFRIILEEV